MASLNYKYKSNFKVRGKKYINVSVVCIVVVIIIALRIKIQDTLVRQSQVIASVDYGGIWLYGWWAVYGKDFAVAKQQ